MALNTYSDISTYVNSVFEDALFIARESGIMQNLVTRFDDRSDDAARKSSEYNQGTARSVGEQDDLTSDAFTPSVLSTLTPAEIGLQFFLTDRRLDNDPFGARQDAARELGLAIADHIETALLGDLASVTGGTVGAAGSVCSFGYLFAAQSVAKGTKIPGRYNVVLHDYTWHPVAKSAAVGQTVTNSPDIQNSVMRNWYVGSIGLMDIYTSANITPGGTVNTALFNPAAIALDMRRPPRLEIERDSSRRGWELNMTCVYAHGVWRPKFGVKLVFDASAPTS